MTVEEAVLINEIDEYWEQIFQTKPIADEIVASWMPLPEGYKPESEVEEDKDECTTDSKEV